MTHSELKSINQNGPVFVVSDAKTTNLFSSHHRRVIEFMAVKVGESGNFDEELVLMIGSIRDINLVIKG